MTAEGKRLRIAVAEDDNDFRDALVRMLAQLGHEVMCAAGDGGGVVDFCETNTVDLVIVDLDMPIVDGLEAAEHIVKRNLPVILLSGHSDVERVDASKEPITVRLRKPVSIATLKAGIETALRAK